MAKIRIKLLPSLVTVKLGKKIFFCNIEEGIGKYGLGWRYICSCKRSHGRFQSDPTLAVETWLAHLKRSHRLHKTWPQANRRDMKDLKDALVGAVNYIPKIESWTNGD